MCIFVQIEIHKRQQYDAQPYNIQSTHHFIGFVFVELRASRLRRTWYKIYVASQHQPTSPFPTPSCPETSQPSTIKLKRQAVTSLPICWACPRWCRPQRFESVPVVHRYVRLVQSHHRPSRAPPPVLNRSLPFRRSSLYFDPKTSRAS